MRKLVILFISTTLIVLIGCSPKDIITDSPETGDIAVNMEEAMVLEIPNEGGTSGDIPVGDYVIEEPVGKELVDPPDDYTIVPDSWESVDPPGEVAIDIIGSAEAILDDFSSEVEPAEPFIVVQEPDIRVFDVRPGNVGEPDNQSISGYAMAIIIGACVVALIVIGFVVYKRKRSEV